MVSIAEEEAEEARQANEQRKQSQSQGKERRGSDVTMGDVTEEGSRYEDFVSQKS